MAGLGQAETATRNAVKGKVSLFAKDSAGHETRVLFVPGHVFYAESVEPPSVLEPGELREFAELTLESIAPFPVEQLLWGYLAGANPSRVLIYATHRDRLKRLGYENLESYAWVFPGFAAPALAGAAFAETTDVLLDSGASLDLLTFEPGESAPWAVASLPREEAEPDEAGLAALRALPPERSPSPGFAAARLGEPALDEYGLPVLRHENLGGGGAAIPAETRASGGGLRPAENRLWAADVRPADFAQAEKKRRAASRALLRLTSWAAVAMVVLALGEAALFAGDIWLSDLNKRAAERNQKVLTIQSRHSLVTKLNQVSENELRPVRILEALDAVRPRGIYFDETVAQGQNRITVEGVANTVNELNRYTEKLRDSKSFRLIGTPRTVTRGGKTTFSVTLAYDRPPGDAPGDAPDKAPASPEQPEQPDSPAPGPAAGADEQGGGDA